MLAFYVTEARCACTCHQPGEQNRTVSLKVFLAFVSHLRVLEGKVVSEEGSCLDGDPLTELWANLDRDTEDGEEWGWTPELNHGKL